VYLSAAADTSDLTCVKSVQQFRQALEQCFFSLLRILLAPAGLGKFQWVFFRDRVMDGTICAHKQQLHSRGSKVNTNIQLQFNLPRFLFISIQSGKSLPLRFHISHREERFPFPQEW